MVLKFQPFQETEFGRDFWVMFWVSLVVHIGLLALVAFSRGILPPPIYYAPPSYSVDLVTMEEQKPARPVAKPTPAPSKPIPKAEPKTAPKPKEKEKIPIPEVPKKVAAKKEEVKKEVKKIEEPKKEEAKKAPKETAEVKKEEAKAPPEPEYSDKEITSAIAGLKKKVTAKRKAEQKAIAARGRVTSRLMEIKYKVYYNTIWGVIRDAWTIPEGLKVRADLETIIGIRIAKDGRVISIDVEKGSGNGAFDDSAIRAIEKSSPLPPFPGNEPELEVGFRFTPEDSQ